MSEKVQGANRVSQTPSKRRLKTPSEAESTTSGGDLFHGFDNADRKSNLVACQMGQLMVKFEAMATKMWICWRLETLVNGEVHPPMEYVIHQD